MVYVQGSVNDNDTLGNQSLFDVKEAITNSHRYLLSQSLDTSEYQIIFVSIPDSPMTDGSQLSSAYSYVPLAQVVGLKGNLDIFLTNYVGDCGYERITGCSNSIVVSTLNYFDTATSNSN